ELVLGGPELARHRRQIVLEPAAMLAIALRPQARADRRRLPRHRGNDGERTPRIAILERDGDEVRLAIGRYRQRVEQAPARLVLAQPPRGVELELVHRVVGEPAAA